jgi:transcriptional regulator with XRE-family HTH domain
MCFYLQTRDKERIGKRFNRENEILVKHGVIARILKENNLKLKDLAEKSGWHYQTLRNFMLLKSNPSRSDRETLFTTLKELEEKICFTDIFPENLDKIVEAICEYEDHEKVDIDYLYAEAPPILEDLDKEWFVKKVKEVLPEKQLFLIDNYFFKEKAINEIGLQKYQSARNLINKAIGSLFRYFCKNRIYIDDLLLE